VLREWVKPFVSCASARGTRLKAASALNAIVLRGAPFLKMKEIVRFCAPPTQPPTHASFVLQKNGSIVLYKARACLLPVHKA
jgi:hypothetical protein